MFYDIRFPEFLSLNATSVLSFDTSIATAKNGKEKRSINCQLNKLHFNISNAIQSKTDLEIVLEFFRNVKGRAIGFRYKDWTDYSANNQLIGVGNGKNKSFQLIKHYINSDDETIIYTRTITKPTNNIKIFVDGVEIKAFTVNYNNGLITLNSPPNQDELVTTNFDFDVPVRFNSDVLEIQNNSSNTFIIDKLELIEIL